VETVEVWFFMCVNFIAFVVFVAFTAAGCG